MPEKPALIFAVVVGVLVFLAWVATPVAWDIWRRRLARRLRSLDRDIAAVRARVPEPEDYPGGPLSWTGDRGDE